MAQKGMVAIALMLCVGCLDSSNSTVPSSRVSQHSAPGPRTTSSATAAAGPFGLWKGMNEEQLRQSTTTLAAIDATSFTADSVPNPHRAFESYTFHLTQTHGLCRIQGIGTDVAMNMFGTQLKEQFQELAEALDEKYGTHKSLEAVAPGSAWNNPEDWPMALVKQEAMLAATWDFTNIPRDDGIQGMTLEASAMSREKGYVVLTYYFDNSDLCIREINRAHNSVF